MTMMMNTEQCPRWSVAKEKIPEGVVKIDRSLEVDARIMHVYIRVRPWRIDAVECVASPA